MPLAAAAEQITLQQFQFFLEFGELGLLPFAGHGRFGQDASGMKQLALTSFQIIGQ